MSTRRARLLLAGLIAVIVVVALTRAVQRTPQIVREVRDPGAEALTQIYGSRDTAEPLTDADDAAPSIDAAAAIRGQVVLPSGEPAGGATVSILSVNDSTTTTISTDPGGMFTFSDVAEGNYVAEASHPAYGPAIAIGVSPGQSQLRLVLQSGRTIHGIVLHRDQPVPFAAVHFGGPGTFPQRSVVADARGQFTLSGLRAGRYELIAVAPGLGSGFGGQVLVDDGEGESARLDVPVYPCANNTLTIIDSATSDPVVTAIVTVTDESLHVVALSSVAEGGVVTFDHLPRGDYYVRVRSPGYMPHEGLLRISGSDTNETVRLSRGAIVRGTVRDEVGNPIVNASLAAIVETHDGARWELRRAMFDDFHRLVRPDGASFWWPSLGYSSGLDGSFELSGLPSGEALVLASRRGWATSVSNELALQDGHVYEPVNLRLSPGRRVRGRVEDAGGGAVSGAHVSARLPGVPAWLTATGSVTSSVGMFDLTDLPAEVVLTVRHPDFAVAEMPIEIPEEGLDGVIVRLSGEVLPTRSGRVFTSRGRPAVGALVWLMRGSSQLPACQATVAADGWFRATHCSALPERLIVSYADHAPLVAELGADEEPRDWTLPLGGEIEVMSQRVGVVVDITAKFALPAVHWPPPQLSLDRWSRDRVRHVPQGSYSMQCASDGHDDGVVDFLVNEGQRTEVVCPNTARIVTFTVVVVDPQGAPVPGAVVFIDRVDPPVRTISGPRGEVEFQTRPGVWIDIEAMHEAWGRGYLRSYTHFEPRIDPPTVTLSESIGGEDPEAMLALLTQWGVAAVVDGKSVIIEHIRDRTPAAGTGIRRHDRLLWARQLNEFRLSLGVRRDGDLHSFELVREVHGD